MRCPGIEPGSREWESRMITITPTALVDTERHHNFFWTKHNIDLQFFHKDVYESTDLTFFFCLSISMINAKSRLIKCTFGTILFSMAPQHIITEQTFSFLQSKSTFTQTIGTSIEYFDRLLLAFYVFYQECY